MRLFVAIDLPKEVKDHLYEIQESIGSSDAKVKWVSKKNFHETLKFLGEVPEGKLESIKESLKKVELRPFTVSLNKLGFFPNEEEPTIIWVSFTPEEELRKLSMAIDAETMSIPVDHKFKSHLTIGRIKQIKFKKEFFEKCKNVEIEPIEFEVNSFTLMRSTLTKNGPVYETLETYS